MRRNVVALAASIGVLACGSAWAAWPEDKTIEVVIGFAPGGGTDVMARKLLPFVEQRLGGKAKFVVLNKPGAGGEIAFAAIARAAPDAYSMGVVNVPGYIDADRFKLMLRYFGEGHYDRGVQWEDFAKSPAAP